VKKLELFYNEIKNRPNFPEERSDEFSRTFSRFKSEMKAKWQAVNRTEALFLTKNKAWLQGTIKIPLSPAQYAPVGRPQKSFDNLSDRSKRRKTLPLRKNFEAQELLFAGQMKLREGGNITEAKMVKTIVSTSTETLRKSSVSQVEDKKLSPAQALSMFVEASLTRRQYEIIRETSKDLYPCYSILQQEKKKCYPPQSAIHVTETSAEVELQYLLNHTAERLCLYLNEVLETLSEEELSSLQLIYKWGCDGSQQTQYKQTFLNPSDSDANLFQSSLVPLRLICTLNNKIVWHNATPSSPRYCRPMRIRFTKESTDTIKEEVSYFTSKIAKLEATRIHGSKEIVIFHKLLLTMVDGKVCNSVADNKSTMKCYICKATSKQFNEILEHNVDNVENLEFGLSILHARIRFFECLLHLSYKIPIKKWQTKSEEEKNIVKQRKEKIQHELREQLGLIVDVPKPHFGNSNDGNTSRRFFANMKKTSQITGVDLNLMERFAVILEVISSGHKINIETFSAYCQNTAKLYVNLYHWYPMTPTVHKILIHGPVIIHHALLPIGNLSEEAAEARNKYFRKYRECFARKFSRIQCNTDILNRLLLSSDIYLSSNMKYKPKKSKPFTKAALEMLLPGDIEEEKEEEREEKGEEKDGYVHGDADDNDYEDDDDDDADDDEDDDNEEEDQ